MCVWTYATEDRLCCNYHFTGGDKHRSCGDDVAPPKQDPTEEEAYTAEKLLYGREDDEG